MKRIACLLLALALALGLAGCAGVPGGGASSLPTSSAAFSGSAVSSSGESAAFLPARAAPEENEACYDLEQVVLYLEAYGALPPNYITKNEARALGWQGGSVERWQDGAAIGGDHFGNREGLLPTAKGRKYTECDLDTLGANGRGPKRLIFSNDGLYFYTEDHYETFLEVWVTEGGEVAWE